MKILFTLPYIPVPPTYGGALRVYHLIRLASERHDVTVLSYGWPDQRERMREQMGRVGAINLVSRHWPGRLRRVVQFYSLFTRHSFFYMLGQSKEMQHSLDGLLERKDFDVVQTEFAHMGTYRMATSAHKILDSHNVEYDNFRRMGEKARSPFRRLHYYSEYKKFRREEQEACRRYDSILVTSARDGKILDADVPHVPKYVVPNGVEAAYFRPGAEAPEPFSMVFTGAMSYIPNHDGMCYFLDSIFPLILRRVPSAKIYIVGSQPMPELMRRASENIIITGTVDDVRPYVWRSSVYVVPLRMGSGTRLKVLEAMAMKIPIVTTGIGSEGIDVHNGETALISDDPSEFADSVVRLLHDHDLRRRLSEAGHDLMKSKYEWSVIGENIDALYGKFTGKSAPAPAGRREGVPIE